MNTSRIVSSMGGAIAILSILFLPVIGCEDLNLTGIDLIQEEELGKDIKYLLMAAVACGFFVIVIKNPVGSAFSAIAGGLSLLAAYLVARQENEFFDLRVGSFVAILGFAVVAFAGLPGASPAFKTGLS